MIAGWSPGIGDPTPVGWLTVLAYLAAAMANLRAAGRDAPDNARMWLSLFVFLGLLAVNKQLDLQSLLTAVAREEARNGGWYDSRRWIQEVFILMLLAISTAAMAFLLYLTRRRGRPLRVAMLGITVLLLFVCVRASSFHHMDALLGVSFLAMSVNHVLEIGGIAIVGIAGWMVRRPPELSEHDANAVLTRPGAKPMRRSPS
ncbi:MAG: hypothetical protein ABW203_01085 [Novosphingobium sp.]